MWALVIMMMTSSLALTTSVGTVEGQGVNEPFPSASRAERNWEYVNHDSWGTNYSPQNEINRDNVKQLVMKWVFPFPTAITYEQYQPGGQLFEGVITPPLVVDGSVYVSSNMRNIYAFDAETGELKWENIYEYDWGRARSTLPEVLGGAPHIHGIEYIDGMLYTSVLNCAFQAINASSGKLAFEVDEICHNVEGNFYDWPQYRGVGSYGSPSHPGAVFLEENIMVVGMTGAGRAWGGGRAFLDGYDLNSNPPRQLWRTYLAPPAEGDREWALRDCDKGWFFSYKAWKEEGILGIPCTDVPQENLMNDWGVPKHYTSGVSAIWGQMAVDEETGIIYLGTGNQGGWPNQTFTPGPNLYAGSTMAIDARNGEIVWWYQQVVRDMVEGDSSWNTVLTKMTIDGEERKVIIKFSATGLLWALDAASGEPIWIFEAPFLESRVDPDGTVRGRSAGHPCVGCDPNTQDGYWNDVRSYFDMQEKKWLNYPSEDWFYWIPSRAGEADLALDRNTNTIFIPITVGVDLAVKAGPFGSLGVIPGIARGINQGKNVTLYALDAVTGMVRWSYFIDGVSYRGGVMASGGVVYLPAADGNLYMFDSESGEILDKRYLGTSLVVLPTIGKTKEGESRLFVITGGRSGSLIGGITPVNIPGALLSFGLPDLQKPEIVIQEVVREVEIRVEVVREVEVIREVEVPVSEISPLSYAIAGIGLVMIILAFVTFSRRRT